jgi:hypothetical protein
MIAELGASGQYDKAHVPATGGGMNGEKTALLVQLIAVRETIHELAFGVGILVLGLYTARW